MCPFLQQMSSRAIKRGPDRQNSMFWIPQAFIVVVIRGVGARYCGQSCARSANYFLVRIPLHFVPFKNTS